MSEKASGGEVESQKPQEKCSRPYRLGQRETAMGETRAKILGAARELILGESALAGFSMEAVARQAGVTRVTVYHRFSSKRGLLEALFDEIGSQGQLGAKIPAVFARTDALEALRAYIQIFCEFWEKDRVLNRRLRGFAALDADFAAAIETRYERRQFAIENLMRRLGNRIDLPEEKRTEAVQTVLALTGFSFYDVLAGENRPPEEVTSMLFSLVSSALGLEAEDTAGANRQ